MPNNTNPTAQAIVAGGGTPFSPQFIPFNAPGTAICSTPAVLTCNTDTQSFLMYLNYSPNKLNNFSLRAEWYDDREDSGPELPLAISTSRGLGSTGCRRRSRCAPKSPIIGLSTHRHSMVTPTLALRLIGIGPLLRRPTSSSTSERRELVQPRFGAAQVAGNDGGARAEIYYFLISMPQIKSRLLMGNFGKVN